MTQPSDISPEESALVAEYALGLLAADEAAALEARLSVEPALAAELAAWQRQFATLAEEEVDPVMPPPALEERIERELFARERPSVWSQVAIWRGLALAGFASTIALAAVVLFRAAPPTQMPPAVPSQAIVAQLAPVTGQSQFLAVYDSRTATLRIRQAAGTPEIDRAQELWLIEEGTAPVSLGLLAQEGSTVLQVPDALQDILPGALLAVSNEPPGGSPTGAPTGDVLAAGQVLEI